MKVLMILFFVLLIGLTACINDDDPTGGVEPPMNILPFEDLSLEEARKTAFQKIEDRRKPGSSRQLVVVILSKNADEYQTILNLGYLKEDKIKWKKNYLAILLHEDEKDAQTLIKQYNIQDFPVTIKESISINGSEVFSEIKYGVLPQVSGKNKIDIKPVVLKIYKKYENGDKNKLLLTQLRDHLAHLGKSPESTDALFSKITNDYLNQFSKTAWSTYSGYRLLKKEAKDVRYDVLHALLSDRVHYNDLFFKITTDNNLKDKHDADWIIQQAILKSFQKAAIQGDISLFEQAMAFRNRYRPAYKTIWILKAILAFHIKREEPEEIRFAALEYFSLNKNWTAVESNILEASAFAINEVSDQKTEWIQAEKWIERSLNKYPNPTNYRLQYELLQKIGDQSKAALVLEKIKNFQADFTAFKKHYPTRTHPIVLDQNDITKSTYQQVKSIPKKYNPYYRYIAREHSLYMKSKAVEAIALLSENVHEVSLLTRVHLVTGSILPATHYRSYYIQSKFSIDGEHLESVYVNQDEI